MDVVYALQSFEPLEQPSIFLAGPSYRPKPGEEHKYGTTWRQEAIKLLEQLNFSGTVFNPEFQHNQLPDHWTYSRQVSWESEGLKLSTAILFWVPRSAELPGFTTNIEFGQFMQSGKIVVGAPESALHMDYIREWCSRLHIPYHTSLTQTIHSALDAVDADKYRRKLWFTSDTHFSSQRTLELSKRPFKSITDMDTAIVRHWNERVNHNDVVYHLGDFGATAFLSLLNAGEIRVIAGNYDDASTLKKLQADRRVRIIENNTVVQLRDYDFHLIHEPDKANNPENFYLFGHIHKLQMVKRNGLNVGVDCHDFSPVDVETILFWQNAINNHFDHNVFMPHLGNLHVT
jgi:calcineurin-like phosphoesterase family protein